MKFQHDTTTETELLSEAVIEAVAEAKGVDPVDLTPALYDVIDPDALDELFASIHDDYRTGLELTFTYSGHQITVTGKGQGHIEETR